jgi:aldehyde:ferredoxin oxidoreductase
LKTYTLGGIFHLGEKSLQKPKPKTEGRFKMSKGYLGKIMRVDLTQKKIWDEPIPNEEVLRKYIGCFPLGLWYLEKMVKPGTHPLDPKNPLIFLTGPLTGTAVPSATNTTITTLNASTKRTVGRSHSHGFCRRGL